MAKTLGISQQATSRRRNIVEHENSLDYTSMSDMKRNGFEILAFTFCRWNFQQFPDKRIQEMKDFVANHPNILLLSTGIGSGYNHLGISVHRDYSEYIRTIQEYKAKWGECFKDFSSFIVSLQSDNILENLSLQRLANIMTNRKGTREANTASEPQI